MKVIIIGGGQVGSYIAKMLISEKHDVTLFEIREDTYYKLIQFLPENSVVLGSGTDPTLLERCGIDKADAVAAVTGDDETNLVVSTITKFEFGVPRVIARVNNPKNEWLFNSSMGVDVGLNMADLMAHLVVEEMDFKNMLTLMMVKHDSYSIIELKVGKYSKAVKKTVKELAIPDNAILIALYHGKDVIIPKGNTVIEGGDVILAFTDKNSKAILSSLLTD